MISRWRKRRLGLRIVPRGMWLPESGQLQHYGHFLEHSRERELKGNPPCGQNFEQLAWWFTLLGRRNGQRGDYTPIHELWPAARPDSQGLRRNMIKELLARVSEKLYVKTPLRTGK